jgi:hypothetical protein
MGEVGELLGRHDGQRTLSAMTDLACRSCGSTDVIPDATVNDHDAVSWRPLGVTVRLARPESTQILGVVAATRDSMTVPLQARVCGECGVTDLYATDPRGLWAAYRG